MMDISIKSKRSLLFIYNTLFLLLLIEKSKCFMDMEELKSIYYGLDILNEPVVLNNKDRNDNIQEPLLGGVKVVSKYGQEYQCSFPDHAQEERKKEEEEKEAVKMGVVEMLKPMKAQGCLKKTRDWWTYEFCYGKSIRQYHMEEGEIRGLIMHLGFYESDFDWSNQTAKELFMSKGSLMRYHWQNYTLGDTCDLTGLPRRAQVRFVCEESASSDYLHKIEEDQTCVYTLYVMTPRICSHPDLRPPLHRKPVPITCSPVLTTRQYEDYLNQLAEEKKASDKYLMDEMLRDEKASQKASKKPYQMDKDLEDELMATARDVLSMPEGSMFPKADKNGVVSREAFAKMFGSSDHLWRLYQNGLGETKSSNLKRKKDLQQLLKHLESGGSKGEKEEKTEEEKKKEEEKEEKEIFNEFEDEIHNVRSRFKKSGEKLASLRKRLSDKLMWEKNLEEAIHEAEEEFGLKMDPNLVSGLSSTLNKLTTKLQQTQEEYTSMEKEIDGLIKETDDEEKNDKKKKKDDATSSDDVGVKGEGFDQQDLNSNPRVSHSQPLSQGDQGADDLTDKIKPPPSGAENPSHSSDNLNQNPSSKSSSVMSKEKQSTFPLPKDNIEVDPLSHNNAPGGEDTEADVEEVENQQQGGNNNNDGNNNMFGHDNDDHDDSAHLNLNDNDDDEEEDENNNSPLAKSKTTNTKTTKSGESSDADSDTSFEDAVEEIGQAVSGLPKDIKQMLEDTLKKEYDKKLNNKLGGGKLGLDQDHSFLQDKSVHVIQAEDEDGNTNRFVVVMGFKNNDDHWVEQSKQSTLEDNYEFVYKGNKAEGEKSQSSSKGEEGQEEMIVD